ncbi:MAG: hypothetical protein HKN78_05665 [Sphingomonadaceae bacterium]|nr:hypothetical protein [Sphingomonadaceae bacterium]
MIFSALLLLAGAPPLNLEWFADEEVGALALEEHMMCIANYAFERRNDDRESAHVANEVAAECADQTRALTNALIDIFNRNPQFVSPGQDAESAARDAVDHASRSVEQMIAERRE